MDITGNLLEIIIRIHQEGFVTPLVKMPSPIVLPVIIRSVGDIKMSHEFLKVSQRSFDKQMEVVGYEHISQDFGLVNIPGALQKIKEGRPIRIV
jgi:hypothetical protein